MDNIIAMDLKLVIVGDASVGKTCIVHRFVNNDFSLNSPPTVRVAFTIKRVQIDQDYVNVGVWDIGGQERYMELSSAFCKDAGAAILCFDLTNHESFVNITHWARKVRQSCSPLCQFYMVGTKLDLITKDDFRQVSVYEASTLAKSLGIRFIECSARTGVNCHGIFAELIRDWHKLQSQPVQISSSTPLIMHEDPKKKCSNCCHCIIA